MHLKYFLAVISLVFLIQCTNAPSDLASYEKFHYFDEITMQGVGTPNAEGIRDNEFVYVKNGGSNLICVYYPFKMFLFITHLKIVCGRQNL
jgi:hypothetical protein